MKTLVETYEFLSEDVRIEKTLMKRESPDEFPEPMKWKLQMLYFDGDGWVRICRIDNYLHEGRDGSHIHTYGNKHVRWVKVTFQDAYGILKDIGARILREKFGVHHDF